MQIDTNKLLEFRRSRIRVIGLFLIALIGTLGCVFAWPMASFVTPGSFHQFMGWLGALLFGAYSLNFAWALLDTAQPVLTIAPDGIRDRRIASECVAWNTVEKLSIFGARVGSRSLVVQIPTSGWQGLSLTLMARWERLSNRCFGIVGLMVRAI